MGFRVSKEDISIMSLFFPLAPSFIHLGNNLLYLSLFYGAAYIYLYFIEYEAIASVLLLFYVGLIIVPIYLIKGYFQSRKHDQYKSSDSFRSLANYILIAGILGLGAFGSYIYSLLIIYFYLNLLYLPDSLSMYVYLSIAYHIFLIISFFKFEKHYSGILEKQARFGAADLRVKAEKDMIILKYLSMVLIFELYSPIRIFILTIGYGLFGIYLKKVHLSIKDFSVKAGKNLYDVARKQYIAERLLDGLSNPSETGNLLELDTGSEADGSGDDNPEVIECPYCKKTLEYSPNLKFCIYCGRNIEDKIPNRESNDRATLTFSPTTGFRIESDNEKLKETEEFLNDTMKTIFEGMDLMANIKRFQLQNASPEHRRKMLEELGVSDPSEVTGDLLKKYYFSKALGRYVKFTENSAEDDDEVDYGNTSYAGVYSGIRSRSRSRKIRCEYCGHVFDDSPDLEVCPYCNMPINR